MSENLQTTGRLLVLVPDGELDEARYAKKSRSLAEVHNLDIVFIGLIRLPGMESQMRRKLVTLSGIAGSEKIKAEFKLLNLPTWVDVLHHELQPQDFIVCPEEFDAGTNLYTELAELKLLMKEKVYFIPGIFISSDLERREQLSWAVLNWAGIIFLLVAGFIIEVDFDHQTAGLPRILFQIILLAAEIASLWFWNTLFIRRESKR